MSIISTAVADKSRLEYSEFLTTFSKNSPTTASKKDVFEKRKTQRFDHFYFENFDMDRFPKLSVILQSIFVLSHGQAAVECGFSLSQLLLRCNMKEMSIVSRRRIKDYMITRNFVPSNVRITPELIKSVSLSHDRYTTFLKDQKNCEKKKSDLTQVVESLNGDFGKYSLTAADENDPKKMKEMLVKGRGLKREADKAEKDIIEIEKIIQLLKSKRKYK